MTIKKKNKKKTTHVDTLLRPIQLLLLKDQVWKKVVPRGQTQVCLTFKNSELNSLLKQNTF